MNLRRRHYFFNMCGILLLHALIIVVTAVFIQEAVSIKRYQEKNRVNILDLEKRIKLIIHKTMPRTVAPRGIVFTTELEWRTGRDLFHHHHFLYRKEIAGGDVVELHPRTNLGARFIPPFGKEKDHTKRGDDSSTSCLLPIKCMKRKRISTDCYGFARSKF
jgi:hypothetical protein